MLGYWQALLGNPAWKQVKDEQTQAICSYAEVQAVVSNLEPVCGRTSQIEQVRIELLYHNCMRGAEDDSLDQNKSVRADGV